MNDQQIEELFEFYVLGTLSEKEYAQVEHYVAKNPEARARLEGMMHVSKMMPFGIVPVEPAPEVKEALMSRVRLSAQERQLAQRAEESVRKRTPAQIEPSWSFLDWLRSSLAVPAFAALCLVLLFGVSVWAMNLSGRFQAQSARIASIEESNRFLSESVATLESMNSTLTGQIERLQGERQDLTVQVASLMSDKDTLEEQIAAQQEVMALFSSPRVQTITVAGTEEQPEATAQIIYDAESQVAILTVTGLEPLAPDQAYQVLLIRNDGHDTAETFRVDTQGYSVLLVHSLTPFDTFNAIGVSVEPATGSPQRTGEIVLLGNLIN